MLPCLVIAAALTFAAPADDAASRAARLKAIQTDVASSAAAYWKAREQLPDQFQTDPAVGALGDAMVQKRFAGYAAALEVAKEDPGSDVGLDALEWLLLEAPRVYHEPAVAKAALELMARHHAANPKVAKAVGRVALYPPVGLPLPQEQTDIHYAPEYGAAMDLLKAVAQKNPDRTARGQAALGLARQAKLACQTLEYKGRPAGRSRAEAEQTLESVARDFADCPCLGWTRSKATVGEWAKAELFRLRDLRPGRAVPEIAGEDLDGAQLKLSDYRGKVVLLVFWASWCGPCISEVPHERELVEQYKDRPFAIVGVNDDEEKAKALAAVAKYQIPWRSFWNGPPGTFGPSEAWNVRSLPTVYLIDHKGVVRDLSPDRDGKDYLDKAIAKLVAEAGAGSQPRR